MNIPTVVFDEVAARIAAHSNPFERFRGDDAFNTHQGFLSFTRGGKSYLIRYGVLPIYKDARQVVLDVKPGGAKTWNGWANDVTELKPGFGRGPDGTARYRLMLLRGEAGKAQIAEFLSVIKEEGSCILVIDDSRQITSNAPGLGLREYIDELLTIGAEIGITAILAANSSVWATSTLRDQCGIYWVGQARNTNEQKEFMKYAGLPREVLPYLGRLKRHQFLYSDQYDGDLALAITQYMAEPGL